jgi:hypothetical protein
MEEEKPKEEKKIKEIVLPLSLPNLKGKDKFETAENYSILSIVIGVIILSLGIGLTIVTPKGIPAILAMLGSFISFLATVVLILVWLVKEFVGE